MYNAANLFGCAFVDHLDRFGFSFSPFLRKVGDQCQEFLDNNKQRSWGDDPLQATNDNIQHNKKSKLSNCDTSINVFCRFWGPGPIFGPSWPILGPTWAQLRPTWFQQSPNLDQNWNHVWVFFSSFLGVAFASHLKIVWETMFGRLLVDFRTSGSSKTL